MKYLAILKDSLREAIDSKVFYVMVGLSSLLTLLAFSMSFTPRPGIDLFTALAAPLNVDLSDVSPERLQHLQMLEQVGGFRQYEVIKAEPLDGAACGPQRPYKVTLQARFLDLGKAKQVQKSPRETEEFIKSRFARINELRIVEVTDVRLAQREVNSADKDNDRPGVYFELIARPTKATLRWWPHDSRILFGAVDLGNAPIGIQLFVILSYVINGLGAWVAILVSVVITAYFIPNMLRKGTIDLLLVKPIHRSVLLVYKYLGGLFFILLNTTVIVLGLWLALGLRSGIWAHHFLLTIFAITFFFAILYAVSTLFAVLTRSAIVAILMTCGVWFLLFVVGVTYQLIEHRQYTEEAGNVAGEPGWTQGAFASCVRAIHFVTPRTKDLDHLMDRLLASDLLTAEQTTLAQIRFSRISWGESLSVSGVFIILVLGLSCWWFATRDY